MDAAPCAFSPAREPQLNLPGAVVASGIGKLYILDSGNSRLLSLDRGSVWLNFGRTNLATLAQEKH
jgi:hypothetical protein